MHPVQHYETIRKGQEELRRRVMEVRKMHKLRAKTWVRPHTGRSHTDTLLYSPDFLKLWIGESVSMMGSQVTLLAFFFQGIGITGCNVHMDSIRQALIPDKLQGRANASYRLLVSGTLPVGALLGGFLGQQFGLQVALFVGALGLFVYLAVGHFFAGTRFTDTSEGSIWAIIRT